MAWDPALITAVAGAVAIGGGLVVNTLGRKDTKKQQAAANEVVKDKTRLDETQQALDAYETLTERLAVEQRRASERADTAEKRAERYEGLLEEERRGRATDLAAFHLLEEKHRATEDRCRAQTAQLVEAVVVLRATVVSEIAQAAMDKVMAEIQPHPHDGAAEAGADRLPPQIGGAT